jgi:hypothetical protein
MRAVQCGRTNKSKRPLPLSAKAEKQIRVATARAYFRFCNECSTYSHNLSNYFLLMHWIDERRIEMQAEGRRYWVPTDGDFWQAVRDCSDDWSDLSQPKRNFRFADHPPATSYKPVSQA